MKFNRRRSVNGLSMLWAVTLFLVTACSTPGLSPGRSGEIAPPSSGDESSVAYGASLGEWDEATQDESAEPANNETDETSGDAADGEEDTADADVDTDVDTDDDASDTNEEVLYELDNVVYRQIMWDGLMPEGFTPMAVMGKYRDEIAAIQHGSSEMNELYDKIQEELNNAPVNELLNEVEVRLPGFIAPLDYTNETITEFLLVPYFGACIHVPPPPANQTVMVTTAEGKGINIRDSNNPVWVMGKIVTEGTTTNLATAGYNITEAVIEPYTGSE